MLGPSDLISIKRACLIVYVDTMPSRYAAPGTRDPEDVRAVLIDLKRSVSYVAARSPSIALVTAPGRSRSFTTLLGP